VPVQTSNIRQKSLFFLSTVEKYGSCGRREIGQVKENLLQMLQSP